jgi:hypothetical protein
VRGLTAVASVLKPGGTMLLVDAIDWALTIRHPRSPLARLEGVGRPWWWRPNAAGLGQMVTSAGFRVESGPKTFRMVPGTGHTGPKSWRYLFSGAGPRQALIERRFGDPHAWVIGKV